jgi:hypothetical protein
MNVKPGALIVVLVLLGGCASVRGPVCNSGEQAAVQDTLYFGAATAHGSLSDPDWARFLQLTITPRFPKGLTVWDASGQWLSANGSLTHEASHVLQIVHPDDGSSDALIGQIIDAYKTQFHQESVLRVKINACAAF